MHVSEKFLRRSPEVKDLLSGAGWVVDLVWLDVSHDTDGSHYQLHTSRRTLHGLHNGDVCRLGGGEGGGCVCGECVVREGECVEGGGCICGECVVREGECVVRKGECVEGEGVFVVSVW